MNVNLKGNMEPFSIMNFRNLNKNANLPNLPSKAKANGNLVGINKTKSHMSSNMDYTAKRNITRQGNDTRIELEQQRRIESSRELVKTEKVNGNNATGIAEKVTKIDQVSSEALKLSSTENRNDTNNTTRNTERSGNVTQNKVHVDTATKVEIDSFTQVDRQTDTQANYRTYGSNGKLIGESFNRQTVTTDQSTAVNRDWQGEGTRDIEQQISSTSTRNGDETIRATQVKTQDIASSDSTYNTNTVVNTNTQVDQLDAKGNVIKSKTSGQQVVTDEERIVASDSKNLNEQNTINKSSAGKSETISNSRYDIDTSTKVEVNTTGNVRSLNEDNAVVSERSYVRNEDVITTEKRSGENEYYNAVKKENGNTITNTQQYAASESDYKTASVTEQGGITNTRIIEKEQHIMTFGDIESKVNADGDRKMNFQGLQITGSNTEDLAMSSNGTGRIIETNTYAAQSVEGKISLDADSVKSGTVNKSETAGSVLVRFGSNTGISSSFKMDNGTLKFDFTAQKSSITQQSTTTGKVADETHINGQGNQNISAVDETIHFAGTVTSTIDANGNRVISLESDVKGTSDMNGFDTKLGLLENQSEFKMNINGKLEANRQTSIDGNQTDTKLKVSSELSIEDVVQSHSSGTGSISSAALNTANAMKAGLISNNKSLQFNFGSFSFGIELIA